MTIPLIKPYITESIKKRVCDVLESGYLTEGPVTKEFEDCFRKYVGCSHAIAVTSCTTGLEVALRCLGVGPGDEVIVPDYTYPATAAVVPLVGATAVIVDVKRDTMLIDYDALEKAMTSRTRAIIPVSLFGNPLDYDRIQKIKEKYGIFIIEDAACSIGAEYKNIKVGNFADITVFSLHPRKFITTGEGGIITTNNGRWAEWMNSYKHFGMKMGSSLREGIQFEIMGTNYKLSNVLSAIGVGQMEYIDTLLERRRCLAECYLDMLRSIPGIGIPDVVDGGRHSYQSFCIFVSGRESLMKMIREAGIEVQIGTYSLHMHTAFQGNPQCLLTETMNESRYCYEHCLTLPLYHDLTAADQEKVIETLRRYL